MPEPGQYVTYPITLRPETLDAIRAAAKADDVSIRKWVRDALIMAVKVNAEAESRRQAQQRLREQILREQASA